MNTFKWWTGFMTEARQGVLRDIGLLAARLALGGMMAFGHGWGKLTGFSERHASFADPLGVGPTLSMALAVFAEFFCSILLMAGLATRFAAFNLWFTMMVAGFIVHAADPFQRKELALVYAAAFFLLMLAGPGRFSADHQLMKR